MRGALASSFEGRWGSLGYFCPTPAIYGVSRRFQVRLGPLVPSEAQRFSIETMGISPGRPGFEPQTRKPLIVKGLVLPDVEAKGYLDTELVCRLRQKESLGSVKQRIVRKLQQNKSAFRFEDLVREVLKTV